MLQRQVDVLADLLALGHRVEHVVRDRGGVEVEEPDPRQALDRVQPAEQPRQRAALAAIDAEERRVLRNQQQLAHARRPRAASASRDDRVLVAAAVLSAQRRNDAERARVVAALGHLHVRVVPRRRLQPRRRCVVEIRGQRA